MSAAITDVSQGIITFRISGQLTYAELVAAQQQAAAIMDKQGKTRFLVIVENFLGTEKTGEWGDVSFQVKYDPLIEKIAIVGDKKFEDLAVLFTGKGVRRVAIEYFAPAELAQARAWLVAGATR
jgi:hypothetical protein